MASPWAEKREAQSDTGALREEEERLAARLVTRRSIDQLRLGLYLAAAGALAGAGTARFALGVSSQETEGPIPGFALLAATGATAALLFAAVSTFARSRRSMRLE